MLQHTLSLSAKAPNLLRPTACGEDALPRYEAPISTADADWGWDTWPFTIDSVKLDPRWLAASCHLDLSTVRKQSIHRAAVR